MPGQQLVLLSSEAEPYFWPVERCLSQEPWQAELRVEKLFVCLRQEQELWKLPVSQVQEPC